MEFFVTVDEKDIRKERNKAKEMRKSGWWKQKLGQGVCYYCEQRFEAKDLTMDHIVPVSRGGKTSKGNVVTSCKECNNEKSYKTPAELLLENMDN